ncbi:uncharacterized protein CLUP02_12478 [Colletotrichum lupini]|uniref:Uncharacterized protein n=1 Tax=Colletotrichum lupini TaxID=145971 RepID=A0A9Q8WKU7_9PEZI|nr:uncharacterized protein CLUP02_12478 [Colletotrichum lupini]UQC86976.1 hypothetical protein CLUP02_12478 [Colletotrichum lupini]
MSLDSVSGSSSFGLFQMQCPAYMASYVGFTQNPESKAGRAFIGPQRSRASHVCMGRESLPTQWMTREGDILRKHSPTNGPQISECGRQATSLVMIFGGLLLVTDDLKAVGRPRGEEEEEEEELLATVIEFPRTEDVNNIVRHKNGAQAPNRLEFGLVPMSRQQPKPKSAKRGCIPVVIMKGKPEPEPKRRVPHQLNQVMAARSTARGGGREGRGGEPLTNFLIEEPMTSVGLKELGKLCIQIMSRDYSQVLGYHRTCRNAKPRRYASIVTRNPVVSYAGVETGDNLILPFDLNLGGGSSRAPFCIGATFRAQREDEEEGLAKLCNEVMNPAAERNPKSPWVAEDLQEMVA